jgi:hypothetical protein
MNPAFNVLEYTSNNNKKSTRQYATKKQSLHNTLLNLKSYTFRLYETAIIRLYVSENCKEGNHIAVAMHSAAKMYGRHIALHAIL